MAKALKGCINDGCVAKQKKMHFKDSDDYCPKCGQPLYYVCKRCGMQLPDNTKKYCLRCENELKDKKDELGKTIVESVVVGTKKAVDFSVDKGKIAIDAVGDTASDLKDAADRIIDGVKEKTNKKKDDKTDSDTNE